MKKSKQRSKQRNKQRSRSKRSKQKSKIRSRSKKDGVKKSSILFPLLASTSLLSSPYLSGASSSTPLSHPIETNSFINTCQFKTPRYEYESDLTFAIITANNDCAKALLTEYNLNEIVESGRTPLNAALVSGNKEMVEYLIANGADVNKQTYYGDLPLTETDDINLLKLLLENGAKIDYANEKLNSVIVSIFKSLNKEYIKLFIDHGINLKTKLKGADHPLYIYSILSGNILNTLNKPGVFRYLIRYLYHKSNSELLIYTIGAVDVFYILYITYYYFLRYIPPNEKVKIDTRLFKSMEEIQKITTIYNYNFEYSSKFKYVSSGLIYLTTMAFFNYKYKNSCAALNLTPSSIIKILDKNLDYLFYKTLYFDVYKKSIKTLIGDSFLPYFRSCLIKPDVRFVYIFLYLYYDKTMFSESVAHANIVIYDTKLKTLERFEPHGSLILPFEDGGKIIDEKILEFFNTSLGEGFVKQYYKPVDFCPKFGFQNIESIEMFTEKEHDPGGFCSTWSYFYLDMRLKYPDIDKEKLIVNIIYQITYNEKSFKEFIREYGIYLLEIQNKVLENFKGDDLDTIFNNLIKDLSK